MSTSNINLNDHLINRQFEVVFEFGYFDSSIVKICVKLDDKNTSKAAIPKDLQSIMSYQFKEMMQILLLVRTHLELSKELHYTCLKYYELDPCHYFNAPGLSWDAMLKMTGAELEKISDIDMYFFIEKGLR